MSCCEVSIAPQLPSPARYTLEEPGCEIEDVATLLAVVIWANFVSAIAADELISAFTIEPSAIFAEVTALSETVVICESKTPGFKTTIYVRLWVLK